MSTTTHDAVRVAVHTRLVELLAVGVRSVGVVFPGAALLGVVELLRGPEDEDFGPFLGAIALSLLTALLWAARDTSRTPTVRATTRWVATALVVAAGLGTATTLLAPGSPPGERVGETVDTSLFYGVPLLVAAGSGVLLGAAARRESGARAERAGRS